MLLLHLVSRAEETMTLFLSRFKHFHDPLPAGPEQWPPQARTGKVRIYQEYGGVGTANCAAVQRPWHRGSEIESGKAPEKMIWYAVFGPFHTRPLNNSVYSTFHVGVPDGVRCLRMPSECDHCDFVRDAVACCTVRTRSREAQSAGG